MKYTFDHDLHIHSQLSLCSGDPAQSAEAILEYGINNGLKTLCVTDHFWDAQVEGASDWYKKQDFAHINAIKPLPQAEGVKLLFGCETDMDMLRHIGIAPGTFDEFDFVIIPINHLHMRGFTISEEDAGSLERRAQLWAERFEALLDMPLPFHKVGVAHLACSLMAPPVREEYLKMLELIPDAEMERLFAKAADVGIGIELNSSDMSFGDEEADRVLRMFRIAKAQGCKFYCGSDAHHPDGFEKAGEIFVRAIELLGLTEEDKFCLV